VLLELERETVKCESDGGGDRLHLVFTIDFTAPIQHSCVYGDPDTRVSLFMRNPDSAGNDIGDWCVIVSNGRIIT